MGRRRRESEEERERERKMEGEGREKERGGETAATAVISALLIEEEVVNNLDQTRRAELNQFVFIFRYILTF